jgi:hypothetical protein
VQGNFPSLGSENKARQEVHGSACRRSGAAGAGEAQLAGQIRPNKTKQNSLDLLGFIRPNWDFSMGYGDSK